MAVSPTMRKTDAAREIGGLLFSCVQVDNPMLALRAVHWRNALSRVGLSVPFWAVHDIGVMATTDPTSTLISRRKGLSHPNVSETHRQYIELIKEIAESEVLERARQWRISDNLISVLLLRVLGPSYERFRGEGSRADHVQLLPLDAELYSNIEQDIPVLFAEWNRDRDLSFLNHLVKERLRLVTAIEQIDLDTLRLLGMFGAEASAANAMSMLDLLSVFESPSANDVVNFSLDLLPSVLETKRATGQQTFSVDGYSGVSRRGNIDSLVLSELAFEPQTFARRFVEKEVFYYAREKQRDEDRRLHYIMVDASASMRGQRSVFARGLALTMMKKLLLRGEDVYLRFFDSRLYEVQHARPGRGDTGGISVPYILCFKGERGRNYAKVFGLLANDLQRLKRRERRTPILYFLTHAQCHIPVETVERLRSFARLYGVFMLPSSGQLELEYLPRLHTVQVVDEQSLNQREARAQRALDIVEDAAKEEDSDDAPRVSHPERTSVPPRP